MQVCWNSQVQSQLKNPSEFQDLIVVMPIAREKPHIQNPLESRITPPPPTNSRFPKETICIEYGLSSRKERPIW
jgi:hypothetical protein